MPDTPDHPPKRPYLYNQWSGSSDTREKARQLRSNQTDAERKLWTRLRRHYIGGHRFRRQQPLGSYIVDFFCFEKGLIIEVDGSRHMENAEYDSRRTAWLEANGYKVIRFWDNEVLTQTDAVCEVILQTLDSMSEGKKGQGP